MLDNFGFVTYYFESIMNIITHKLKLYLYMDMIRLYLRKGNAEIFPVELLFYYLILAINSGRVVLQTRIFT